MQRCKFPPPKYVVEGLLIKGILSQIFSSKEAVRNGLINAGIAIRESHTPHNGRKSQSKFGGRLVKGKVIEYKQEQHVISAIVEMKTSGMTLRQIADTLQAMKIPTKCRGRSWHPEMVRRIFKH